MACNPEILRDIPLFALLDNDEMAVLASQVELKTFADRQRIYKIGDPGGQAYVMVSGKVRVTTVDEDHQEVVVDEPARGEFFGFASMLDQTPHQTAAMAIEEAVCMEVDRKDIAILLERKPHAGMDYTDRARTPVSQYATIGAHQIFPKSERGDRIGDDRRRASCRRRGEIWRVLVVYHHVRGGADRV